MGWLERLAAWAEATLGVAPEFDKLQDVDFAYPTMRRFDNRFEGKVETRAEAPKEQPAKPAQPSTGRLA